MTELPHAEPEFDFRYWAHRLWQRRWLLLCGALAGLGLGALAGWSQTPEYKARAVLQVEPPTPTSLSVTDALVSAGTSLVRSRQFYNTQFQILRSRELAERVVERLKLDQQAPLDAARDPASAFLDYVSIEGLPESMLVEVAITHRDPEQAALWANTLADIYIDRSLEGRVESLQRAYSWLQERLADTEASMQGAREELLRSYENEDLFVPEGSLSASTASIIKLSEDFVATQGQRIALEAALKQFAAMRRQGARLTTVPQVASDPVVIDLNAQLASLELEQTKLLERYKPAHPEVQKARLQAASVRKARDERIAEIEQSLRAEYRQLRGREAELETALEEQKSRAATETRKATTLQSLQKKAESAGRLYEVLLQKLNETDIASTIQRDNVRFIQRAHPPAAPAWPPRGRFAGIGLLLGLAFSVSFVLLRDYFDNTLRDPEEIERYLHVELLASVPRYDRDNAAIVTEAYQSLRTSLLFARRSDASQVVLVTGTAPQEGKTTTLLNVAKLLAVSGERTIVLDCDLRRASVHKRLGLPLEPGVSDYFAGSREPSGLIRPTRVKNLFALTAGSLPPNPPALLANAAMGELLEYLRRHFRWVLVDSPPLASVTDGLLLAQYADMSVMVVRHNTVDRRLIRRSLNALRKVTDGLAGAVLNAVDFHSQSYNYYYYQRTSDQNDEKGRHRQKPSRPVAVA